MTTFEHRTKSRHSETRATTGPCRDVDFEPFFSYMYYFIFSFFLYKEYSTNKITFQHYRKPIRTNVLVRYKTAKMRTIIFRGKRTDNGEWIEGDLHLFEGCFIGVTFVTEHIDEGRLNNHRWIQVIPETVGQFTGLQDITGRKIFEGDIITYSDFRGDHTRISSVHDGTMPGWIGTIEWDNHSGWRLDKENEHNKEILKAKGAEKFNRQAPYIYYNDYINRTKPEVIGNIHDTQINASNALNPIQPHSTTKK